MTETVRTVPALQSTPQVSFTVTPTGGSYTWTVGATVYDQGATTTAINSTITFTATATFSDSTRWATSYEWDFGDGAKGYGSPVTHTYLAANSHTQAVLTVVDNKGERWRARKQIYLA